MKNLTPDTRRNSYCYRTEIAQTRAATLCRSLSLLRGLFWVIAASLFLILFSAQQANAQGASIAKKSIQALCENRTLLLSSDDKYSNKMPIKTMATVLQASKLELMNGSLGALTMSQHSEIGKANKTHYLQRMNMAELERINKEISALNNTPQKKSFLSIMFGSTSTSQTTTAMNNTVAESNLQFVNKSVTVEPAE